LTANLERLAKKKVTGALHSAVVRFPKGWGPECLAEVQAAVASAVHTPKAAPEIELTENGVRLQHVDVRVLLQLPLALTTAREILGRSAAGRPRPSRRSPSSLPTCRGLFICPGAQSSGRGWRRPPAGSITKG
jgi:hypothetical protein